MRTMIVEKVKREKSKRLTSWLRSVVLLLVLFATNTVQADDVSVEEALQIARQFAMSPSAKQLSRRNGSAKPATPQLAYSMSSTVAEGKANIYVINLGNDQGFVIVSGEDGTDDVLLGYCDHGSFSFDDCPVQMKDLLGLYSNTVDSLRQQPMTVKAPRRVNDIGSVVVPPLLTTTWYQWAPYNDLCPEGCPTGCVPTAVAQIMKYWKWPKQSSGCLIDPVYGDYSGEDFSGHVYDWDNMLDSYSSGYTAEQAKAVAYLMADIGKALGTTYTPEGSGTATNFMPLSVNFSYSPDLGYPSDLPKAMKAELDQRRPMLYSATGVGRGAHELVCDGYTSNDYFHFNYGWGGSYDGFYKIEAVPIYNIHPGVVTGITPLGSGNMVIDNIEYILRPNGEAEISRYTERGVDGVPVVIPDEVTDPDGNTYKVTRIWKNAFYAKGHFSKLTLGNNIKFIDQYSFIQSTIDTLIIGDKIEEIPDGAFQLTRILCLTIGSSVKRIGKQAFRFCGCGKIICKSPLLDIDDEAFFMSYPDRGEWLRNIRSLGYRAFCTQAMNFPETPQFDNLESIGTQAFWGCKFPSNVFYIPAKLKKIAPDAFGGSQVDRFVVDERNEYFTCPDVKKETDRFYDRFLFNKSQTSLVVALTINDATLGESFWHFPETMIKMEPGSVMSRTYNGTASVVVPSTVLELGGAFSHCDYVKGLRCLAPVPPRATDDTFSDYILKNIPLRVPQGTEELYRNAPGWRRFKWIYDDQEYVPAPDQDRQYNMVVNYTDPTGSHSVSVPVGDVGNMQIDEGSGKVTIMRNGQLDFTVHTAFVDSITWMTGFVYENAEVFDLNEENLIADGQKCTVKLGPTVIDTNVQLCIRNALLTPNVCDGILRGQAVDISLSTGEHDLAGTAEIIIPLELNEGERMNAACFNPETGEWDPVYFWYDEDQKAVVILTNHFSLFSAFTTKDDDTRFTTLWGSDYLSIVNWDLNESLGKLYKIVNSENIDEASIQAWRDDYSFWQGVGIDGGWNLLQACGFQPEAIGRICDMVGYLGTAATILDVAAADLAGNDIAVASNTMKAILSLASGKMASAIGTSIMSVSMVGVAFIGIVMEKFGTKVQEHKTDLFRKAYRLYYSDAGKAEGAPVMSKKDWILYFLPAIERGNMSAERFTALIEQAVRRYCDRFWEDNGSVALLWAIEKAGAKSLSSFMSDCDASMRQQISDEFFAELMEGQMAVVAHQLKKRMETIAQERYAMAMKDFLSFMNTQLKVLIYDSSKKQDEKSEFAGWKVRFSEVPKSAGDPEQWECTLDDDGKGELGWFTVFALLKNKMKCSYMLVDPGGVEQRNFQNSIKNATGKLTAKLDVATGGTEVEVPHLRELELVYDPAQISPVYTWAGTWNEGMDYHESSAESMIFLDNLLNKRARFQTEIEKFFKRHGFIVVDEFGHIRIGDDIVGQFDGNEGKGSFTINTTYPFMEKTVDEYVKEFNEANFGSIELLLTLLNGIIKHKIDCQFTVVRIPDSDYYAVSYTGEGTYQFDAEVVDRVEGVDFDNLGNPQHVVTDQITTRQVSQEGKVTLNYVTKLK